MKMTESFKNSIFGVIYILLKDDDEPYWLCSFLNIYDGCEKLAFPFNNNVNYFYY